MLLARTRSMNDAPGKADPCGLAQAPVEVAHRANFTAEPDFAARNRLDEAGLLELFAWTEDEFLQRTEGSAIRRTGYINWLRNLAVALGNAEPTPEPLEALRDKCSHDHPVVCEHAQWALQQLETKLRT